MQGRAAHYVQSLARGLAVIRAFQAGTPELTLSDVARATGLTRAAARRFLLTLVDLGYVGFDGKYFSLTARVLGLGYAFLSSTDLPDVAQPHLQRLSAQVGESSSVSVLDGTDIVYVARVAVSGTVTVGRRLPAETTSVGHVLLAGLDDGVPAAPAELRAELARVRELGWALVDHGPGDGVRSLAAPIRDRRGGVVAAIEVSTRDAAPERLVPPLLTAAKAIGADLAATLTQAHRG